MTSEELLSRLSSSSPTSTKRGLSYDPYAPAKTEKKIQQRSSSIGFLKKAAKTPGLASKHPFVTGLSVLGAPFEAAESTVANVGLGLQQGTPWKQIGQNVSAGVRGERPAQLGDIARASGIPILRSEPVASVTGFLTSMSPGLLTKTGRKVAGRVSEETVGHVKGAASLTTVGSRAKLGELPGQIADEAREVLSKKFGESIDQAVMTQAGDPSKLLDLENVGQLLQQVKSHLSAGTRHAASSAALELVENPSLGKNIGLEVARNVKAAVQRSPEINRPTEAGRLLREARDLIRHEEVTKLDLGGVFKEFKSGMDLYRQVHPRLPKVGISAPVTTGIKGITESERVRKPLEKLAQIGGKREEFAQVLGAARTAGVQRGIGHVARFLTYPAALAAGTYLGAKKFLSPRQ